MEGRRKRGVRRSREGGGVSNKLIVDEKEGCFVESDVNWKWDKGM